MNVISLQFSKRGCTVTGVGVFASNLHSPDSTHPSRDAAVSLAACFN